MKSQIHKLFALINRRTKSRLMMFFALMGVTAALEMVGVGMFLPLLQLLATPESALENSGIVILADLFEVRKLIEFGSRFF